MVAATATRVGPFALGPPQPQWGTGWFAARVADDGDDDLPRKVLLRVALPGEAPSLAAEGARRMRIRSAELPELLRRGDAQGRPWLCYAPQVAVKLENVLDEPLPVPVALALAASLASALSVLETARHLLPHEAAGESHDPAITQFRTPINASFDELLLTDRGTLVVTTPPPGTRMALPGLLKVPRRDRFLYPPEGLLGFTPGDIYAVGAVLHMMLTAAEPFASTSLKEIEAGNLVAPREHVHEIPGRVDDVVRRAMALDPAARFESMPELIAACARAADDFPPAFPDEMVALVRDRAGISLERARVALESFR